MYFIFILPINISTKLVANKTAAVEKFAGRINAQTINTGNTTGTNASLKSLMLSCFFDNVRATKSMSYNFAKSEV